MLITHSRRSEPSLQMFSRLGSASSPAILETLVEEQEKEGDLHLASRWRWQRVTESPGIFSGAEGGGGQEVWEAPPGSHRGGERAPQAPSALERLQHTFLAAQSPSLVMGKAVPPARAFSTYLNWGVSIQPFPLGFSFGQKCLYICSYYKINR